MPPSLWITARSRIILSSSSSKMATTTPRRCRRRAGVPTVSSFRSTTTSTTATPSSSTKSGTASAAAGAPLPPPWLSFGAWFSALFAWYSKKLDTHPLLTKGISSGIIGGTGDLLCQAFIDKPEMERRRSQNTTNSISSGELGTRSIAPEAEEDRNDAQASGVLWWWDGWRTARFGFLGFVFVAPGCHYWYGALAARYPLVASSSTILAGATTQSTSNALQVTKRVILDQFVFSPVFLVGWMASFWTLESHGPLMSDRKQETSSSPPPPPTTTTTEPLSFSTNMATRLADTIPHVLVANWILWIPVQALNFSLVPTKFQVLTSNCVALVWNSYLSFSTRPKSFNDDEPV